jgi:ATP-dependent helicase YprA (DUF1998 family)
MIPLLKLCRTKRKGNDLRGKSRSLISRNNHFRLTFYDAVGRGGGAGISCKAFDFVDLLLQQAVERVDSCGCENGCPECTILKISLSLMSRYNESSVLRGKYRHFEDWSWRYSENPA